MPAHTNKKKPSAREKTAGAAPPVAPVRAPQQRRSQATYERTLDAVGRLVAKDAYENATVADIVRLANSSVGAFYGRFADKDAAMFALFDARCAALEGRVLDILERGRARDSVLTVTLSAFIDCAVDHTFSNAALIRAERYLSSAKTAEPFWARGKEMNAKFLSALTALLKEWREDITHPDPKTAALITLSIVGGLPRDAVVAAPRLIDTPARYVKDYKAEITRIVRGYLGIQSSCPS